MVKIIVKIHNSWLIVKVFYWNARMKHLDASGWGLADFATFNATETHKPIPWSEILPKEQKKQVVT